MAEEAKKVYDKYSKEELTKKEIVDFTVGVLTKRKKEMEDLIIQIKNKKEE